MIKVTEEQSRDRVIVISGSSAELAELYAATRRGRRSRGQQKTLEQFGDELGRLLGLPIGSRVPDGPGLADD
jgi:hypothetical protein